jgi:branched-chain amino acid transport system ATP-binding protein
VTIEPGTVLAVLGPNGAGKTSLANALSGSVPSAAGKVHFDGIDLRGVPAHRRAQLGLGHLPDSRGIFPSLTVAENLRMGFHRRPRSCRADIDAAYELFPSLARRKRVPAGRLSGGEQQMLALSRLLIAPPRLLIVDELSHGLAPGIVANLFESLAYLKGRCSMLVVEQFVSRALELADNVLVLSHGEVRRTGPASAFTPEVVTELYSLHVGAADNGTPGSAPDEPQQAGGGRILFRKPTGIPISC